MNDGETYNGDPRWIVARAGRCAKCDKPLAGKWALFCPNGHACFCEECNQMEMADAALFDDALAVANY